MSSLGSERTSGLERIGNAKSGLEIKSSIFPWLFFPFLLDAFFFLGHLCLVELGSSHKIDMPVNKEGPSLCLGL